MPDPAAPATRTPCHAPGWAEAHAADAELARAVFGYELRQDPADAAGRPGWWSYCAPWSDGVARWHVVPGYGRTAHDAAALRRRLCALGLEVGLFAEPLPQLAGALGGRVVCVVRRDGVAVARGEASGEAAEAAATAAAALALVRRADYARPALLLGGDER